MKHASLHALLLAPSLAFAANDIVRANGYDDAWQAAWETHLRAVHSPTGKTLGKVLQVGDSMTHANPYTQWPRGGVGKTADDVAILAWCHGAQAIVSDAANPSGFVLAAADVSGSRGFTARGGMDCDEFLDGDGMPHVAGQALARAALADAGSYPGGLRASTVAVAYADAEVAVIMLGTNDVSASRTAAETKGGLVAIIDLFEAQGVAVVISTIPPHIGNETLGDQTNASIRALARERSLPLIDFDAEIRARRPNDWNGTLLGLGDVHPSAADGTYGSASDPYADGGDPATHTTGQAAANVGYLLRSWLTVQKLKEVKAALDGGAGTTGTGTAGTTGTGTTGSASTGTSGTGTTGASGSGSSDVGCGRGSSFGVIGAAGVALALMLRRQRR
ncbi:MAG TPA: SGNH/GDSL hydrolase family protein [Planctomycetota bacterium]|nr:SGNH/GDSL hydrolase family protein [Planctomycetota bacterium]